MININKNMVEEATIETYEITYEKGLLAGKTIYYRIIITPEVFRVQASWDKYEDFVITLANFVRYADPVINNNMGFTMSEVLDYIANNDECYYDVAEFVDMLKERME